MHWLLIFAKTRCRSSLPRKECQDKSEFNLEDLLTLKNKRKRRKSRNLFGTKGKDNEYFSNDNGADDSSDSGESLDEIYDEKDFNKKFAFKKGTDRFDYEGFS